MPGKRKKDSPSKMSLSRKRRKRTDSLTSTSVRSDRSKDGGMPNFSMEKTSSIKSLISVKSGWSKDGGMPNFREEALSSIKRFTCETLYSDLLVNRSCRNVTDNLMSIFKDLEIKIISFLKNELGKFKKILQRENTQNFVKDFTENRWSIKESALDLTLHFLREMKQDDAADTLEDELVFIQQLKCNLKKKYRCVFEGIAKQGDSTLLNNIYTDLFITQGGSEQVNTEHEIRQIEVASRRSESEEIQVECKQLFETSDQDKEITTVLTKGVAGIGKSISVQKFVLDWAEGKENQDISLIFPLPFREMNLKEKEKHSLMDLITQFFPETKGLKLTRRKQLKVLFILDGLDECRFPLKFDGNEKCCDVWSPVSLDVLLTNLIKGNLLPSALVWITTRPAAAGKIPPECIDRLTEIRGFSDAQKEEYFRKRFTDQNQAKEIIDHVKKSKSLFIMCHIPVFCWISATVVGNILEERKKNDLKNNQTDGASKTLQESNTQDTPKTLTQMYTHFLRFQIIQSRRKYDGEYIANASWDKDAILSLGNLAFEHLKRNNLIFYETDLEDCGIDVYKASVYSGMCTQIFKQETGIILGTMYCFVHLSIQEFIAALYAHLFLDINKKNVLVQDSTEQENKTETMIDLLKTAVDKALESDNGHLDLFLRFLLGLSLQSNRRLLGGLLTKQDNRDQIKKEIVQYIKQKFDANLSPERSINLFYCLNELNDQTLVKEIQTHLSRGSLLSADLSPAQWSALAFVLLTSEEEMEEFELQKFQKSDECLIRLSAVIRSSKRALLNNCNLTHHSCSALATVLGSDTNLKELNISDNSLLDSGVKLLCTGLMNINCKLEILRLSNCRITEGGYKALASVLRSNPSHLIELDLTGNDPGLSGVKELTDLLQNSNCHLKILRFLSPDADKACHYVTEVVGKNPLLLKELNLSGSKLGDIGVNQLAALLQDKHCTLNTLIINRCRIREQQSLVLTSSLKSNPSYLKELDLSENQIQAGVNNLCDLMKDSQCKLKRVRLRHCCMTNEGCSAVASALKTNPSHLRELNLSENKLGDSGVKNLHDLLTKPQCKLEKLHLCRCGISEQQSLILTSALKSNPSHLKELDLSENQITNAGVIHLRDLLKDSRCKLERLRLSFCDMTDEGCSAVASALKSNPSHLRELNLSVNELGYFGVKHLSDLLNKPQCKLEKLHLFNCSISENLFMILTSALKSNPSHLRELDLSENQIKNPGLNHLSQVLKNSHCKLEKLSLFDCGITDVSALTQSLTNTRALQFLKELDLRDNNIGDSKKQLADVIQDSNCKLRLTQ